MFGLFETGFASFYWGNGVMLAVGAVFLYLGIAKKMEPLLLVPIGFGVILVNLPIGGLMECIVQGKVVEAYTIGGEPAGLISRIFHYGLVWELIPCLIFLGLGAMTDFSPVIANPKTLILGAGAQFGVYFAFFMALLLGSAFPNIGIGFGEAASIGIIGGADGPTTIYLTNRLAPHFIGATAVAAYTYMAMVPIIQPPIIKALTTKAERAIYMKPQLRPVSRLEKILFPVTGAIIIILLVPKSAPMIGMFMMGNLLKESGVTDRLADTAANAFINILTILLGVSVGAFMSAGAFLKPESLLVFGLGITAFAVSTFFGVILAKFMNLFLKEKINPMIGAAGVSAVPMSSRVVQKMGQQANPRNFLLMHAMGPNVAGVIGTATAAGIFLGILG
ncbi:MAG: sodium ion-translocating decarboxylase subunit beta [Dehalococcoidales bacterium]|nr:sodium ion-translocating decarboxylase subunit beta [Dehalococcoidales bacterium]